MVVYAVLAVSVLGGLLVDLATLRAVIFVSGPFLFPRYSIGYLSEL